MQKKLSILIAILLAIFGAIIAAIEVLEDKKNADSTKNIAENEKEKDRDTSKDSDREKDKETDKDQEKPKDKTEKVEKPPINENYTYIHTIQGASHISPMKDREVKNVYGVVTVAGPTFFIIQTPKDYEDADPRTSEALKVKTTKNHGRTVGELILVDGVVDEYRSHKNQKIDRDALTLTQLKKTTNIRVLKNLQSEDMPAPIVIGKHGRKAPDALISNHLGSVETTDYALNLKYGLDFYEALESMLVQINDAIVVSPIEYESVFITPDNGKFSSGLNSRGSIAIAEDDGNPEIIKVKAGYKQKRLPKTCETGDSLGTVIGTIDYDWGNYTIYTTKDFQYKNYELKREVAVMSYPPSSIKIASFNVLNLDARDSYERFNELAQIIVNNLYKPDILVLEEIQDNNGASSKKENGGTGAEADKTYMKLITAIKQADGPKYKYAQIDPVFGKEGGEPVGNIRVGFLYNPKSVSFIERGNEHNKSITATKVEEANGKPQLTLNPGRIEPQNHAWENSRPALAGEFMLNNQRIFVIGVHFKSKGGDASPWGWNQNQQPASEQGRIKQAQLVCDFASKIIKKDPNALVVIAGDFNEFHFRKPLTLFKNAGFENPAYKLDPSDRYSMIYAGNAQLLDHILIPKAYYDKTQYDIVHVNSEFCNQASDHDPVFALIDLLK